MRLNPPPQKLVRTVVQTALVTRRFATLSNGLADALNLPTRVVFAIDSRLCSLALRVHACNSATACLFDPIPPPLLVVFASFAAQDGGGAIREGLPARHPAVGICRNRVPLSAFPRISAMHLVLSVCQVGLSFGFWSYCEL